MSNKLCCKRLIAFIVAVAMIIATMPLQAVGIFADDAISIKGDGTEENPYLISNADELYWFAEQVNTYDKSTISGKLTADITVNEQVLNSDGSLTYDTSKLRVWEPIGAYTYNEEDDVYENAYAGTFDGDGYTVSGLYFDDSEKEISGFFSLSKGTIKNFGIEDFYFNGGDYVGGISGGNDVGGIISNCYATGSVKAKYVGGLCGANAGNITNCHAAVNVSGNDGGVAGGLCGWNSYEGGVITDSYATGSVTGGDDAGGFCGENDEGALITNSYSTGNVSESKYAGGICGSNAGTVTNSYHLKGSAGDEICDSCDDTTEKTAEEFESGEVCYLLNANDEIVWHQTLDGDDKDSSPVLDSTHGVVYANEDADGVITYSNTLTCAKHNYDNGICTKCGEYEEAELKDDYYEIDNAGKLYWFAQQVNEYDRRGINGRLTADITVNEKVLNSDGSGITDTSKLRVWTPIGGYIKIKLDENAEDDDYNTVFDNGYTGTFDGDGYTIRGLYYNNDGKEIVGLFSYMEGTVKNVRLEDFYFNGYMYVGGICGYNGEVATVSGCYTKGTVNCDKYVVGGINGCNDGITSDCYSECDVIGNNLAGGISGWNYSTGTISNSHSTDDVFGGKYSGGVVGANDGTMVKSSSKGDVSGSRYVGGICGENLGTVNNSYSTGDVSEYNAVESDGSAIGGICGNNEGTISNSYTTGSVNGSGDTGSIYGINTNDGKVENTYFKVDTLSGDNDAEKTAKQFESGEVCYLLNSNDESDSDVWYQTLDGDDKDNSPVLDSAHGAVYANEDADGATTYSNTLVCTNHNYNNGICTICGEYEEAELNSDGYYEIDNAGKLYWFAEQVNINDKREINGRLTADITVNEQVLNSDGSLIEDTSKLREWTPIGGYITFRFDEDVEDVDDADAIGYDNGYKGIFDGDGYTVSGLYYDNKNKELVGLFSYSEGTIKNVRLEDFYFKGYVYTGGICGYNNITATITNCYAKGSVNSYGYYVGGINGCNDGATTNCYSECDVNNIDGILSGGISGWNYTAGTISDCRYSTGNVVGGAVIGGISGANYGKIFNSYSTGNVSESSKYAGGISGYNLDDTIYDTVYGDNENNDDIQSSGYCIVSGCYSTGNVSGINYVGGITGYNFVGTSITNSYSAGNVSGGNYVGGICGLNEGSTIADSYTICNVSGNGDSVDVGAIYGLNRRNGKVENTYFKVDTLSGDNAAEKTAEQFESGEVCYLLNTNDESNSNVWYQTLDGDDKDSYPVLDNTHGVVYAIVDGEDVTYTNVCENHNYNNGICSVCNRYEEAELNSDGYYEIDNAGKLYWFAQQVNEYDKSEINGKLTADIIVNAKVLNSDGSLIEGASKLREWTPIGAYTFNRETYSSENPYLGTFDGDGHTISGLYYNNRNKEQVGLFSFSGGTVENVGVEDFYFNGGYFVGGICGRNDGVVSNCYCVGTVNSDSYEAGGICGGNGGSITDCYSEGIVKSNIYEAGGICGWNYEGSISNCYSTGSVKAVKVAGGICGWNYDTITNSYSTGSVNSGKYAGGLCGSNDGTISYSYATGDVSGSEEVGGLCGLNNKATAVVSNCYATGNVSGGIRTGGLSGYNEGTIANSYSTGSVSGNGDVGGIYGTNVDSGKVENTYFKVDTLSGDNDAEKTAEQFENGEVCYLLNANDESDSDIWYQTLDGDDKDNSPVLDSTHGAVYANEDAEGTTYSNKLDVNTEKVEVSGGYLYLNDSKVVSADESVTAVDFTTLNITGVESGVFDKCTNKVVAYLYENNDFELGNNVIKKYVVSNGVTLDTKGGDDYKFKVVVDTNKFGGPIKNNADFLDEVDVIDSEINETKISNYTENEDDIEFKVNYNNLEKGSTLRGQVKAKKWNTDKTSKSDDVVYYVTKAYTIGEDGKIEEAN